MFRISRRTAEIVNAMTVRLPLRQVKWSKEPNSLKLFIHQNAADTRRSRMASRLLLGVTGSTVVVFGGALAYAHYDPSFRSWMSESMPWSKFILDFLEDTPVKPTLDRRVEKTSPSRAAIETPKPTTESPKKLIREPLQSIETKSTESKSFSFPVASSHLSSDSEATKSSSIRQAQNANAALQQRLAIQETDAAAENAALTQILNEMTDSLKEIGQAAVVTCQTAVGNLKTYVETLEKSLDTPKDGKEPALWKSVESVQAATSDALKRVQIKSNEAKELIEKIRAAISRGRKSKVTVANPVLLSSEEVINSVIYKLQAAEMQVENAKSEAKVIKEYQELAERAQREFQAELTKLIPEMKIDGLLTEEEFNRVISHSHKRVEQLQRQLAMHQASEKHRFQQALERQRREHELNLDNVMSLEGAKLRRDLDLQYEQKISELREDFEQELRNQLRRQAAAHSDHLQDVLQVQQSELQSEFNRELEEKLGNARQEFEANLSRSYARLQGIEEGIKARADLNKTARMSHNLWLASQSLKQAVKVGDPKAKNWDEQLKPLTLEVDAIKQATNGTNAQVAAILDAIPQVAMTRGIYPETTLKDRFLNVYRMCRRVAMIDEKGGSMWRFGLSYLQSILLVETPTNLSALDLAHKPIDPKSLSVFDVLSRAKWCVERDDLELALRYMNLLRGAPRVVASDWMNEVRTLLEVRQVADFLVALSASRGIQSIM